ncbi:MAG: phage tail tube protein [Clostridium paraputrificum]
MAFSGVFPVYNLIFKIGTKGKASAEEDMVSIAQMETFSFSIDGTVEEWTTMSEAGWSNSLMTGKKFTIGLNGKRCVGDKGNDYVAAIAWKDGLDCSTKGEIEFPDGSKLAFNCVINVKNIGGADSTNVAPLEFEMIGDGKPTLTPAPSLPS